MKRVTLTILSILFTTTAFAQDAQDLDKRLRALEEKVQQIQKANPSPDIDELRREIDILSKEIESLKNNQQKTAVVANQMQYGLGAAASKVYRSEPGVSFGGYGEMLYQKPRAGQIASANVERAVLYTGYKFDKNVLFNSELEVENASTERNGQVSVEFGYLDFLHRPELNARAGLVLLPLGLINEQHEPTAYFGARRPVVETQIIPATWAEMGAGIFGDLGRFSYRTYVVTGLDATKFNSSAGIREGRQAGAEAKAKNLAWTGRLDFHPFEGTFVGGSIYTGNAGQGARTLTTNERVNARVTLGDLHVESKFRGAAIRALWSRGTIGDAAKINQAKDGVSIPENSVAKSFGGWYVEGGYDLFSLRPHGEASLSPYVRYEQFDVQRSVPLGAIRNPESNGRIFTAGFAFKPIAQTVIKADYQRVTNRARTGVNQFNLGVGYIF